MSRSPVPVEVVAYANPRTMEQNRSRETTIMTAWLAGFCGLACVGGLVPAVEQAVSSFLAVVVAGVAVVFVLRWIVRRVRIHQEDREDERLAASWHEAHAEASGTGSTPGLPARVA